MALVVGVAALTVCSAPAWSALALDYQGAFKVDCAYGGFSMAYYGDGDQGNGSLFVYSPGGGTWFCEYALDAARVGTADHTTLNLATALIAKGAQTWGGGHGPAGMEYYDNRVYGGRDPAGIAELRPRLHNAVVEAIA